MPFYFTCPYCFRKTLIDDGLVGQAGPCANCGKKVTIPQAPVKHHESVHPVDSKYVQPKPVEPNKLVMSSILKAIGLTAMIGMVSAMAFFLLWPTFKGLKLRRDKVACMNNLQRIARALNEYAAEYGCYPPPVVYDSKGLPMHSWRVLILPQLQEMGLYARYDLNQAWDSADNAALLSQCPRVYVSPASADPFGSESTYVLLTGQGTLFPKSGPLKPSQVLDGLEATLLVVESKNASNEWTKPFDVDVSKLNHRIGAGGPDTIGGDHVGGATGVFADGTPVWLNEDIDPVLLDALISPSGGEPIDPTDFKLTN